jgi:hypothetical protein
MCWFDVNIIVTPGRHNKVVIPAPEVGALSQQSASGILLLKDSGQAGMTDD